MDAITWVLGILAAFGIGFFFYFLSQHHSTAAIWILFSTVVIIALGGCLYWQQLVWKEETQRELEEPTFREKVEEVTFSLSEGGIHVIYKFSELEQGPKEPFNFGGFSPVKIYVEDSKLYADVTVYGGAGLPPIEIKHNEYVVRPTNWDLNKSSTALEVVNESQEPVFQLIYKKPSHIVVNGIFPFPGGLILANESGMILNPTMPTSFSLERIFKYPSSKYPGKYK